MIFDFLLGFVTATALMIIAAHMIPPSRESEIKRIKDMQELGVTIVYQVYASSLSKKFE